MGKNKKDTNSWIDKLEDLKNKGEKSKEKSKTPYKKPKYKDFKKEY